MDSKLKIYNSLTRQKEVFEPLNTPHVGLYACGPTVYNEVHLGNLRTFVTFDTVFRYLTHLGYKVRYVRNITDAGHLTDDTDSGEDKIEKRARLEQLEPMEVVQKYTNSFHEVCDLFNLVPPSIEPTATGHIVEQIAMVKRILANGYAYESNGSVYFDVAKYMEKYPYGELSGRKVEDLLDVSRDLQGTSDKKNFYDFALWIKTPENALQKWESPWSEGCPGWHLECSAMSTKYLGKQFDIHGGGFDLKFPHHECEIAQNVGADGISTPVKYWMHSNMLTMNGTKMSKSLGNSFLPKELISGNHALLEKGYSPMAVRFFMLQCHYRSTLDFSNVALQAAEKGFSRLANSHKTLQALVYKSGATIPSEIDEVNKLCDSVFDCMNDDFNTAEAIAILFELSSKINSYKAGLISIFSLDESAFLRLKSTFNVFFQAILGLDKEDKNDDLLTEGLMALVLELRKESRDKKDWATSDKIRETLTSLSIKVKDGKDGTEWSVG
ncbi:MAG TPA: cysteine--tRNA ligase [Chitinophagales bacterium]